MYNRKVSDGKMLNGIILQLFISFHALSEGEASKTNQTSKTELYVKIISAVNYFRKKVPS